MKIIASIFILLIFFNINLSFANVTHLNKDTTEFGIIDPYMDSLIISINAAVKESKNIIILKNYNKSQKSPIVAKLLDALTVFWGVCIGALVPFFLSIISDKRRIKKQKEKYSRLLKNYTRFLSMQENPIAIAKDTRYDLLTHASGEFADVIIESETEQKLSETIKEIDSFNSNQNAPPFKSRIKEIWNLK
jgi:hypothetical protein